MILSRKDSNHQLLETRTTSFTTCLININLMKQTPFHKLILTNSQESKSKTPKPFENALPQFFSKRWSGYNAEKKTHVRSFC